MTDSAASCESYSASLRSVVARFVSPKEGLAVNQQRGATIYDWTGEDG